ncbi:MAG TPA: hypothetical protein VJO35_16465 [Terriglobales bacterium]|nr:hypothetical protein [Terriglobales bacterium]
MQVGAIITSAGPQESEVYAPRDTRRREGLFAGKIDNDLSILGNNLFEIIALRLSEAGVNHPTVILDDLTTSTFLRDGSAPQSRACSEWEQSVSQAVQQGLEALLLIGANCYTDLDYSELLRFHAERGAEITQAYANDGALDIAVINVGKLSKNQHPPALGLVGKRERFVYGGYVNRLHGPTDFMQLVEDALYKRCALRPLGTEVATRTWIGDRAEIDDSCVIGSPVFIGANTRVAACCNISGGSAIESASHVDSGTTVERSWILSDTYVGVGLNVIRSIVSKRNLFHIDRRTEVTITDRRLIGSARSLPLFRTGDGLLSRLQSSS